MMWHRLRPAVRSILRPILLYALDTPVIVGDRRRVRVGERVALANTVINVTGGAVTIGDRAIFSPGVMVMTGRHEFRNGHRRSLDPEFDDGSWGGNAEMAREGFDIVIGAGTWVCAGAIISGGVTIGPHSIVAAGAVVTTSFPEHSFIGGVPARRIGDTRDRGFGLRAAATGD